MKRTVVITGAAGALGRVVAGRFLGQGDRLVLLDREQAPLASAFSGLEPGAGHALVAADVTDAAAMTRALAPYPQIDVLVHAAGGFTMGEGVAELGRDTWQHMLDLNAWSFVACAHAVVPAMRARGAGRIIAVSARAAAQGAAGMAAYVAAKSALQRLVETLSAEVREQGIAVNSVAPSIIDTPANRQAMPDADPARWVAPATLAETIAFLASEAGAAIHGQHLVVSGLS